MRTFALAALILSLFFNSLKSQVRCNVELYSTKDGLSHNRLTHIFKDSEGFIWAGSWGGLNRFDGQQFISYKSFPGDAAVLKTDRIDDVQEDKIGNLWLKGVDEHYYRFDKTTEQFTALSGIIKEIGLLNIPVRRVTSFNKGSVWVISRRHGLFYIPSSEKKEYIWYRKVNKNFPLQSDSVAFLYQDRQGGIWVGTNKGLSFLKKDERGIYRSSPIRLHSGPLSFSDFHEDSKAIYFSTAQGCILIYNKDNRQFSLHKVSDKKLNAIRKSRNGTLLFCSTFSGELIKIDLSSFKVSEKPLCPNIPILSIFEDRKGSLWLEPLTTGAIRFNPHSQDFTWFKTPTRVDYQVNNFYEVLEDRWGTVWVGLKGGGFGYFNPESNKIEFSYRNSENSVEKFPETIFDVFHDANGLLWLSTDRGIAKVILDEKKFIHKSIEHSYSNETANQIRALYCDKRNRLWVGAKSGTLSVVDKGSVLQSLFVNLPSDGFGPIYSVLEDKHGSIWIGSKTKGLFKADPMNENGSRYKLSHYSTSNSNLNANKIHSLYENKAGIWIGTFGGGLNLAVSHNGNTVIYNTENAFSKYPAKACRKIRHINSDSKGNLWIASTEGLLVMSNTPGNVLDPGFKRYTKMPQDEKSLGENDIQYILKDRENRMWLCLSGAGLCLASNSNPDRLSFKSYLKKDGLPNDFTLSCQEDKRGNLWIATEHGLSCFNTSETKFINYDENDGLLKSVFSESTSCRMNDGSLAFGTSNGYVCFYPEKVNTQRLVSNIVLTNLQVNSADIRPSDTNSILRGNVNYTREIELRYDQNIVSIDFSVLDHKAGSRRSLMYRLKGLNDSWQNDNFKRRATYTGLTPGKYIFEVSDLYSKANVKTLNITILPPPWKTGWAYVFYIFVVGILTKVAYDIALTVLRLRQDIAVQQKMTDLKVHFFTNVSHELRTPLTLILGPIEEIERKEKLTTGGKEYVRTVRKNAERMLRFMNQWLDLRKIQNGKYDINIIDTEIISVVKQVCDYFLEVSQERNIRFEFSSNKEQIFVCLDAEKIDIVLYNLLANAFKYTPDGKSIAVHVLLGENGDSFTIQVKDEGTGVHADKLEKIFDPYFSDDSNSEINSKGIGIGLAFCRELIELHKGKIYATNNDKGGLSVTIQLKTGKPQSEYNPAPGKTNLPIEISPISLPLQSPDDLFPSRKELKRHEEKAPVVLIVEDNRELRLFLKNQLKEFYQVELAENGEEGLQKAQKLLPDLILTDVMMPIMGGIELLDKVKNNISTSHIPVVLLTAKASVASQIEALNYGADFYITKPFQSEYLFSALKSLISGRRKILSAIIDKTPVVDYGPSEITITSKDEEFLKRVIDIVEEGMVNSEFNIDMVAEAIAMGRTTFYNKFKSLTNQTPVEFVREMRLKRAKQYLDGGESNISTVAYSSGFNNAKYFSTCFKEKYGMSPKEYLKKDSKAG